MPNFIIKNEVQNFILRGGKLIKQGFEDIGFNRYFPEELGETIEKVSKPFIPQTEEEAIKMGMAPYRTKEGKLISVAPPFGAMKNIEKELRPDLERMKEIKPLQQYNDPTAHFRMVREEVRQAAIDKKSKLQFPTGETIMKIEGLGEQYQNRFSIGEYNLTPDRLKVGASIRTMESPTDNWIITDILGEGKFKAVPKDKLSNSEIDDLLKGGSANDIANSNMNEEFDISGKIDTNNPIYRFYEKTLGRYLQSKYGAQMITDKQGVKWWQVDIKPEHKGPVEAFGIGVGAGLTAEQMKEKIEEKNKPTLLQSIKNYLKL